MKIDDIEKNETESWAKFLDSIPPHIRAVAEKFNPWTLYRISKTGSRGLVTGLCLDDSGDVALIVNVDGRFNKLEFAQQVIGVPPHELVECDLPAPGEPLGERLTDKDEILARAMEMNQRGEIKMASKEQIKEYEEQIKEDEDHDEGTVAFNDDTFDMGHNVMSGGPIPEA